jgi:hypothetical protein
MAWPLATIMATVLALAGLLGAVPLGAATTEYVVVDRNTGLAVSGFDPVAYFTDGVALLGKGNFEYGYAGAVWRFRNEGNRAAFEANHDFYMPRFGGYDPVGVARGVGVPGDPRLWLIKVDRLYFFYTEEARATFSAEADQVIATADRMWPAVQLTLSP